MEELASLIGPALWLLIALPLALVTLLVLSALTPQTPLLSARARSQSVVAVVVGTVLAAMALVVVAVGIRWAWLQVGDPSPDRIVAVYRYEPLRGPLGFGARLEPSAPDDPQAGFTEVRSYAADPIEPAVAFVGKAGGRWYIIDTRTPQSQPPR